MKRMKSDSDYRLAAQISQLTTSFRSEWEDNVLFDEDDPDFAANAGIPGSGVAPVKTAHQPMTTYSGNVVGGVGVLRPVSQAACVLNSLMMKGE